METETGTGTEREDRDRDGDRVTHRAPSWPGYSTVLGSSLTPRPQRRMSKLAHFEIEGYCYLVAVTAIVTGIVYIQRSRGRFYLLGFVVRPEHLHLLIVPRSSNKLGFIMQEIKKGSARLINRARSETGKVWMDEYHDSVIRDENDLLVNLEYIANNPVRRGLATEPSGYTFSSASGKYETDLEKYLAGELEV